MILKTELGGVNKMSDNIKKSKFLNALISFGMWIYNFFILQLFWVLHSLKGFIVFGVFPANASVTRVMYRWFDEKGESFSIKEEFSQAYKAYFKRSNQIGYMMLLAFAIVYIDLRVSNVFIQSIILHTLILFLGFLVLCVGLYTYTIMIRYNFSLKNTLKQSFFIALSVPLFTLSAVVGLIIVITLMRNYLFLLFFFGIPLFFLPIVWFTYTGAIKAEEKRKELQD